MDFSPTLGGFYFQIMENEFDGDELTDESIYDEKSAKRCRLPRKQTEHQTSKKLCAKEERNAEIRKVINNQHCYALY